MMLQHSPTVVEKQDPHGTTVEPPVVIEDCPHGQVAIAVAVQITQRTHREAEEIAIVEVAHETAHAIADLSMKNHGPVGVEKQNPYGTAVRAAVVIIGCPDGQVGDAVAVLIPQRSHREPIRNRETPGMTLDHEIVVVGTGFAGLGAAIKLKQMGLDFVVLEKADDIGGTWRDNDYPGLHVDMPSWIYSYSFELSVFVLALIWNFWRMGLTS